MTQIVPKAWPFGRAQRRRGVKADLRRAGDERVVGKAGIPGGVGHHDGRRGRQPMGAERDVTAGLACLEPERGLEPLPLVVHERDQRDRCPADVRRQRREVVEGLLRRRVEHVVFAEHGEAGRFVGGARARSCDRRYRVILAHRARSPGVCQFLAGVVHTEPPSPMRMSRVVSSTIANTTTIAPAKGRARRSGHSTASTPSCTLVSSSPRSAAPPWPRR